jgi:hypothetical protein
VTAPSDGRGGPLPRRLAVVFATVSFFALAVCGLGLASLILDRDVISLPGGGQVPGIVGLSVALLAFGGALALALRTQHPSFWSAPAIGLAVYLFYAVGMLMGAAFAGVDPAAAVAATGALLVSWFGVVIAGAAVVSAWGGIALVRTRATRPRWRWERDDEE